MESRQVNNTPVSEEEQQMNFLRGFVKHVGRSQRNERPAGLRQELSGEAEICTAICDNVTQELASTEVTQMSKINDYSLYPRGLAILLDESVPSTSEVVSSMIDVPVVKPVLNTKTIPGSQDLKPTGRVHDTKMLEEHFLGGPISVHPVDSLPPGAVISAHTEIDERGVPSLVPGPAPDAKIVQKKLTDQPSQETETAGTSASNRPAIETGTYEPAPSDHVSSASAPAKFPPTKAAGSKPATGNEMQGVAESAASVAVTPAVPVVVTPPAPIPKKKRAGRRYDVRSEKTHYSLEEFDYFEKNYVALYGRNQDEDFFPDFDCISAEVKKFFDDCPAPFRPDKVQPLATPAVTAVPKKVQLAVGPSTSQIVPDLQAKLVQHFDTPAMTAATEEVAGATLIDVDTEQKTKKNKLDVNNKEDMLKQIHKLHTKLDQVYFTDLINPQRNSKIRAANALKTLAELEREEKISMICHNSKKTEIILNV